MKNDPAVLAKVNELDCQFRFVHVAQTYVWNKVDKAPEVVEWVPGGKTRQPGIYCQLIDNATKEMYVEGYSEEREIDALNDALAKARTAPKPLTKAQKVTAEAVGNVIADKDATISDLQRQIDEMRAQMAMSPPPSPGRKAKEPVPA